MRHQPGTPSNPPSQLRRRAGVKPSLSGAKERPGARTRNPEPAQRPRTLARKSSAQPTSRPRKNTKRTGEFSEAAFLTKATGLGFKVAKPWGDSERYDFIVACAANAPESFWRIQVKCTEITRARAYEVRAAYTTGKGRAIYTRHDIDFLVAHIVPRDIWYVLPVEACMPSPMLRFYPDGAKCARFEQYREAWHLLHQRPRECTPCGDGACPVPPCRADASPAHCKSHVGTAALACPAEPSSAAGVRVPAEQLRRLPRDGRIRASASAVPDKPILRIPPRMGARQVAHSSPVLA